MYQNHPSQSFPHGPSARDLEERRHVAAFRRAHRRAGVVQRVAARVGVTRGRHNQGA